ncbi:hypothetical protein QAD02_022823 [Eretmocerus hayati]|uniref:Uncharacterized protein n=1 Tax=Eretmocerus hayati TaxID=131215 RepID=A0ACC2PUQ3_9HYME|nr:hypothetical protein QAD02_022823 [Eretmocerus hayati]
MTCQKLLRLFWRELKMPLVMYASAVPVFTSPDPPKDPKEDQKLLFDTPTASQFTYDYLIKQSTVSAVNSASQALTVTYAAVEATSVEYRELLTRLIVLMNEATMHEVSNSHWDEIVRIRNEMQLKKQMLVKFIGYMEYVHKMAEAASEVSFLAGMDNLSSTLIQRIDDALMKIHGEEANNTQLENEYVRVQEESVKSHRKINQREDKPPDDVQFIDLDDLGEE